jgi:hypothetical protein
VYDEVEREGYELPANCPLAKANDMLLPLEAHKQMRSSDRLTPSSSFSLLSSSLSRLGEHPPFPITHPKRQPRPPRSGAAYGYGMRDGELRGRDGGVDEEEEVEVEEENEVMGDHR